MRVGIHQTEIKADRSQYLRSAAIDVYRSKKHIDCMRYHWMAIISDNRVSISKFFPAVTLFEMCAKVKYSRILSSF